MPPIAPHDFKRSPHTQAVIAPTLCLAFVLLLTAAQVYAGNQDQTDSLRKSVFALASARQTALQELENTTMPSSEVADYRDFVVYLNTRIHNYCMELAEQGTNALEGLPCPESAMMTGAGESPTSDENVFYTTGSTAGTARTKAEKTAELDSGFLASLGEFDESLLKEEEKVAARVPSQRETGTSSASGAIAAKGSSKGTGETGSGENGSDNHQGDEATSASAREGQAGATQGTQDRSGTEASSRGDSKYGAPGGKLPPPEDDDIVARQLREAAEKEPDPELKRKLWEEYWKYKGRNKKGE